MTDTPTPEAVAAEAVAANDFKRLADDLETRDLGGSTPGEKLILRASTAISHLRLAADRIDALAADLAAQTARADVAEQFLDNAISNSPQPLKDLGKWLSGLLDQDDWPTAERYLNAAAKSVSEEKARADAADAERDAAQEAHIFTDANLTAERDKVAALVEAADRAIREAVADEMDPWFAQLRKALATLRGEDRG